MPVSDLLIEGLKLLVLGMGSVFAFLVILVFAMMAMSRVAGALDGGVPGAGSDGSATTPPTAPDEDSGVVAAIAAAISRYRSRRR
ncbi:MAG: OadG family transporter subunit [Chromatiales bacterium]|jgi:oxaloacetate decarboxylase gamma subunit